MELNAFYFKHECAFQIQVDWIPLNLRLHAVRVLAQCGFIFVFRSIICLFVYLLVSSFVINENVRLRMRMSKVQFPTQINYLVFSWFAT